MGPFFPVSVRCFFPPPSPTPVECGCLDLEPADMTATACPVPSGRTEKAGNLRGSD
jgi:hypothetical protein